MSVLVVRHEFSRANSIKSYGTPAFGNPRAGLEAEGWKKCPEIGDRLVADFDVSLSEMAAVSDMKCTLETAVGAGFQVVKVYRSLNEERGGLRGPAVRQAIAEQHLPEPTILAAQRVLENPPAERVWFSHGLLMTAMCRLLGVYQEDAFIPEHGEIRELPVV